MMRGVLFCFAMFMVGCGGFYIEEPRPHYHNKYDSSHTHYQYCDDSEPYWEPADEYYVYYDHHGYYEGECGFWYVGNGAWEEWCYWEDQCGWDFVDVWYDW